MFASIKFCCCKVKQKFSQCSRYAVDWPSIVNEPENISVTPNTSWPIEYCVDGWEYQTAEIFSSIVKDVCILYTIHLFIYII